MYLCIDPSELRQVTFIADMNGTLHPLTYLGRSQDISVSLDTFLRDIEKSPRDIEGIAVIVGKGSFTGTRLSVVVANTFAYAYGIPVVGVSHDERSEWVPRISEEKPVSRYLLPTYSAPPSIR